ncbi:MAG: hypothetical protein ACRDGJ_11075 [Candidatus Limnocylindria bacterium]
MTGVALMGGALVVYLSPGTDLFSLPSVSRLGVNTPASGIVNATLVALGPILLLLGLSFRIALTRVRIPTSRWGECWLVAGFALAGSAVTLTGVFDIKAQPSTLVHNVAAFTAPIVLVITLLAARMAIGNLGSRFDVLSAAIVGGILAAFVATVGGRMLPYVLMELICFGLIGAWLWLFDASLRRLSAAARRVDDTATNPEAVWLGSAEPGRWSRARANVTRADSGRYCR